MARRYRLFALLPALGALAVALMTAPSAEPPPAAPETQPAQAGTAPAAAKPRVKPSDPPHLGLFFTDQVVGYIQPCG